MQKAVWVVTSENIGNFLLDAVVGDRHDFLDRGMSIRLQPSHPDLNFHMIIGLSCRDQTYPVDLIPPIAMEWTQQMVHARVRVTDCKCLRIVCGALCNLHGHS